MSFAELESQETVDLTEAEGTLNLKTSFELRRKTPTGSRFTNHAIDIPLDPCRLRLVKVCLVTIT